MPKGLGFSFLPLLFILLLISLAAIFLSSKEDCFTVYIPQSLSERENIERLDAHKEKELFCKERSARFIDSEKKWELEERQKDAGIAYYKFSLEGMQFEEKNGRRYTFINDRNNKKALIGFIGNTFVYINNTKDSERLSQNDMIELFLGMEKEPTLLKKALPETYKRQDIKVIRGTFDPGEDIFNKLLEENYAKAKDTGFNTVYVYVNHNYDNGTLKLVSPLGGPHFSDSAVDEYKKMIKDAKNKGFAIYVALQFGMPNIDPLGVSQEQFLQDAKDSALDWAKISEDFQVEFFSPGSEFDVPIRYEYFGGDISRDQEVFGVVNKYYQELLPRLKNIFKGKTIYQYGYSEKGRPYAPGYDLMGVDFNHWQLPVSEFDEHTRKVYVKTANEAKESGNGWLVAEYWANFAGKNKNGELIDELQDDYLQIATDEYLKFTSNHKPQGFGVMSYQHKIAQIIDRPAEKVLKDFFTKI